jgi:hypothetical protein
MADSEVAWERYRADIRGSKLVVDTKKEKPKLQFYIPIRPKGPRYTRGSGPPPPKPNLRLAHEEGTAFIVDKIVLPHGPFHPNSRTRQRRCYYIIGWDDLPAARPVVDATKILDYASPRTLEDWEYQDALRREEERERAMEAKEAEKHALTEGMTAATAVGVGTGPGAKQKLGRPPKERLGVAESPSEPELNSEQEEMVHKRMKGPSLSTPQKSRLRQLVAEEEMLQDLERVGQSTESAVEQPRGIPGESEGSSDGGGNKRVTENLEDLCLSPALQDSVGSSRASSARPHAAVTPADPTRAIASDAAGGGLPKRPVSTTPIPLPSAFSRMKRWASTVWPASSAPTTVSQPRVPEAQRSTTSPQSTPIYGRRLSSENPPSRMNGFTPIGGTFPRPPKRPAEESPPSTNPRSKAKHRQSKKQQAGPAHAEMGLPSDAAGSADPVLDLVQGQQDYVVKRLEGDYVLEGVHWFRVRWEGDWPADQNPTWEPRENISEKMVKEYLKKKAKQETGRLAKASARKKPKPKQTNLLADQAKACSSVMEAFEGQASLGDGTSGMDFDQADPRDGDAYADAGPDEILVIDEDEEAAARRETIHAEFAAQLAGMARSAPLPF